MERERRWPVPRIATTASLVAVTIAFGVLVAVRRWICDDALIVVRVGEQILEGYGPNFNFFERAEPNTSALWLWLVTLGGAISRVDLPHVAVALGGVLSVAGLAVALDAARRLHRDRAGGAAIVPGGALVVLGVFPFWDFGTSGLETGLGFTWVSASFWLLVTLHAGASRRRQLVSAFVIGLGPLVRPDLALVSLPMLAALWWLVRPRWQRTLGLAAAAFALPLAYTVFRAGYYGMLVPLPALAKSAGSAQWGRGLAFIGRFVVTYHVWLPLAALAGLLGVGLARGAIAARDRVLIAVPVACGLAIVIYVARVGGDFMHGRMLLVPTWLLVLPAMALPLRRATVPALAIIAAWALVTATTTRRLDNGDRDWFTDMDEREHYVGFTRHPNPIDPELFVAVTHHVHTMADARKRRLPPLLIWDANGSYTLLDPTLDVEVALLAGRLGTAGASVALDDIVIDLLGLANPVGARIPVTHPGRTGHEKQLPAPWVLAEYGHPDMIAKMPSAEREPLLAARRAMQCGELAELLASVRDPMTPSRFWHNLVGAWRRTRLVIPLDPFEAERVFCGSSFARP